MPLRNPRLLMPLILSILFLQPLILIAQERYFPPAGTDWEVRTPSGAGLDEELIQQAVNLAMENENSVNRDLRIAILQGFSREPYHDLAGPVRERGGPAGIILKDGTIVASWGDLERVDMTFSVTKSYLSTVAGLAWDRGVIRSIDNRVAEYVWEDRMFDGEHNGAITWEHLLNQSSDWYGTLFGMEDWGDRPPREGGIDDWGNVPDHLYYAAGFGGNYIVVDEENDMVIITRWLDNAVVGEFVEMVYRALN